LSFGFPAVSNPIAIPAAAIQSTNMAANTAHPWRVFLTILPNVYVSANGITSRAKIWNHVVNPLGASNGCAELALSGPPPLVPSSLIASWLANGPPGRCCATPCTVCAVVSPWKFWITPWLTNTIATTNDSGRRMRTTDRVRSTQKLPMVALRRRISPRISAIATASPTAAETKFCTVSPAICVRWLMVDSPE
jgi:hypothetical protein